MVIIYMNTENGYICYITDGKNSDIIWYDNHNKKYIFFSDKEKNPINIYLYFDFNTDMPISKFLNIKKN